MSVLKIGWAEGVCPRCGRVWRRRRPADFAICDCYRYCQICGEEMQPYTPDLDPRVYRNEDVLDPTELASKHEATIRTRYYCPNCEEYSDSIPVEVKLT
jgi:hypothetical protein